MLLLSSTQDIDFQVKFKQQVQPIELHLLFGGRADAKVRSGGRSRGGSFSRPSRSQSNSDSGGSPSRSNSSPYRQSNPVYVPYGSSGVGYGSSTASRSNGTFPWFVVLLYFGVIAVVIYLVIRASQKQKKAAGHELENDVVAVTQLQVTLLAQARWLRLSSAESVQADLSALVENADTETLEGLTEHLRETVLALLRPPENWTHVRTRSQTLKDRNTAAQRFEELSIAERSKFATETLANVGGRIRRQSALPDAGNPAAYIVVTLLVGTEDDRPILNSIHTAEELKAALQRLGSIAPEYLSVFELLWSPQAETDSLSYDEMLATYPDMIQIA